MVLSFLHRSRVWSGQRNERNKEREKKRERERERNWRSLVDIERKYNGDKSVAAEGR